MKEINELQIQPMYIVRHRMAASMDAYLMGCERKMNFIYFREVDDEVKPDFIVDAKWVE
jgi:hypothetical protein